MNDPEVLAGTIAIYREALSDPAGLVELVERVPEEGSIFAWTASTIDRDTVSEFRSSEQVTISHVRRFPQDATGFDKAWEVEKRIFGGFLPTVEDYMGRFNVPLNFDEGFNVLRYNSGCEYRPHHDDAPGLNRVASGIIYLNDDFEGGETYFENFGVSLKPEPGMVVLFPSSYAYRHAARPVLSGTKYAAVTWFHT